ncbi:hypothetical protein [Flavobacterium hungaricum]|uniref:Transposase n=1 Tax=Flavobacterium hungaricum TaxID=2082725 RepID=A0ABR9TGJ1_9FLAO|nr:hypothetical protein [Flavobacterium hungaricum]MBE8724144.1 hypothetical protein [Flavobacterium hungaricum]
MKNYTIDEYVLCTRFKSKRRKKRLVKKDFEKQLIQLDKLEKKLWKERNNLPWIPLEEPYQKGWQRNFKLREDVARSSEGEFYNTLLEKINTWQFSSEKTFKKKKSKRRKNASSEQIQRLKEFTEGEWSSPKLELSDREKVHFSRQERWSKTFQRYRIHYVFNESWRYVLHVKPYMITHQKMLDSDLESQIKLIENYISNYNLQNKINKLVKGHSYNWNYYRKGNPKETSPIKNKSLPVLYGQYVDEMI